jgi:hypothetical protein
MVIKYLTIFLTLIIFSGCASNPVEPPIGIPARPNLIAINQVQWNTISPDIQDIIRVNDLQLKLAIRKLEERIRLHDENL